MKQFIVIYLLIVYVLGVFSGIAAFNETRSESNGFEIAFVALLWPVTMPMLVIHRASREFTQLPLHDPI